MKAGRKTKKKTRKEVKRNRGKRRKERRIREKTRNKIRGRRRLIQIMNREKRNRKKRRKKRRKDYFGLHSYDFVLIGFGIAESVDDICLDEQESPYVIYVEGISFEVDFMIANGITLDLEQRILRSAVMECPLNTGSEHCDRVRQVRLNRRRRIPANSEAIVWGKLDANKRTNRCWIVEAMENVGVDNIVFARTLVHPFRINQEIKYDAEIAEGLLIAKLSYKDIPLNVDANLTDDKNVTIDVNVLFHEDTTDDVLATGSEFNADVRDVLFVSDIRNNENKMKVVHLERLARCHEDMVTLVRDEQV
ncbi:uncharacterized protein LOC119685808 [Teleopsis dalmanni]|uniref:uncharacterized protein LOC119685808 n=1 Tax=Teleopsis dalmanni TaxID=139649 RepID=UPI0018CCAA2C|nr:uncharacterized protein LOC119685808 [Teleopsis dalmanni]